MRKLAVITPIASSYGDLEKRNVEATILELMALAIPLLVRLLNKTHLAFIMSIRTVIASPAVPLEN